MELPQFCTKPSIPSPSYAVNIPAADTAVTFVTIMILVAPGKIWDLLHPLTISTISTAPPRTNNVMRIQKTLLSQSSPWSSETAHNRDKKQTVPPKDAVVYKNRDFNHTFYSSTWRSDIFVPIRSRLFALNYFLVLDLIQTFLILNDDGELWSKGQRNTMKICPLLTFIYYSRKQYKWKNIWACLYSNIL